MKCDGLSSQDNFSRNLLECPVCLELAWPPKKIFQVAFCFLFPKLLPKKLFPICSPPFGISFLGVLVSKTINQGVVFVSSLNQFCVLHFLCFCSFVSSLLATFFCFHVMLISPESFSLLISLISVSRGPHHLRGVQGQPCLEGLPIH